MCFFCISFSFSKTCRVKPIVKNLNIMFTSDICVPCVSQCVNINIFYLYCMVNFRWWLAFIQKLPRHYARFSSKLLFPERVSQISYISWNGFRLFLNMVMIAKLVSIKLNLFPLLWKGDIFKTTTYLIFPSCLTMTQM